MIWSGGQRLSRQDVRQCQHLKMRSGKTKEDATLAERVLREKEQRLCLK